MAKEQRHISVCAKCCDGFTANLLVNDEPQGYYEGYVPKFFPGEHYGDYIELKIDIDTGQILNWRKPTKKDLDIFKKEAWQIS